jgi:hypothetical protein
MDYVLNKVHCERGLLLIRRSRRRQFFLTASHHQWFLKKHSCVLAIGGGLMVRLKLRICLARLGTQDFHTSKYIIISEMVDLDW